MGKPLYEGAWQYFLLPNGEYAIGSFLPGDDLNEPIGSPSLNDPLIRENWDHTQMTFSIPVKRLNFEPGDGLAHKFLDNLGTNTTTNRIRIWINKVGVLQFDVNDKDSVRHRLEHDITDWSIGTTHLIVGVFDFNNDVARLYLDGVLVDDTPDVPLNNDSIDAIDPHTHIGSNNASDYQLNGAIAVQIWDIPQDAAWVAAQWNGGDLLPSVVDSNTILLLRASEKDTGIVYSHKGQKISSIATVTLTTIDDVLTRWANGDAVLVYDDDDPANAVYTTISGAPSGTTIVVADSCAAVSGTNKYISKNLLIDPGMETAGTGNVTVGANQTVTKDGTVVFQDSLSLKDVWAAADDNDESTIWSPTLVTDENYFQTIRVWIPTILDDTTLHLDVDGAATPITSIEVGKSLSDDDHFARDFNLAGTYYLQAANNTIHDIGLQHVCIWARVKVNISPTGYYILSKRIDLNTGYVFNIDASSGVLQMKIGDGTNTYTIAGNTDLRDGRYHFLLGIIDGDNAGNCKIYVDGVEDGTTNKTGTLGDVNSITNTGTMVTDHYTHDNSIDGFIAEFGISYPADIMVAGEMGAAGEIANLYNNPGNPSQWPNHEDHWLCNDNTNSPVVVGAVNNLIASANTDVFAEKHWKMYNFCWKADQPAIEINLSVTGAGAGSNEVEVNVDAGQLRVNMVANGGCEGGADPPANWTQETNATVVSDTSPHSGTNCLKATAAAANVGASQNITLVDGRSYTVTIYAKATAGDTAALVVDTGDATVITLDTITSTIWTVLQGTFVATGTSGVIYVRGVVNGDIVWFDDASMTLNDYQVASTDSKASALWPKYPNPNYIG